MLSSNTLTKVDEDGRREGVGASDQCDSRDGRCLLILKIVLRPAERSIMKRSRHATVYRVKCRGDAIWLVGVMGESEKQEWMNHWWCCSAECWKVHRKGHFPITWCTWSKA